MKKGGLFAYFSLVQSPKAKAKVSGGAASSGTAADAKTNTASSDALQTKSNAPHSPYPSASPSGGLSAEQKKRIEDNKRKAKERLKQKKNQTASSATPVKPKPSKSPAKVKNQKKKKKKISRQDDDNSSSSSGSSSSGSSSSGSSSSGSESEAPAPRRKQKNKGKVRRKRILDDEESDYQPSGAEEEEDEEEWNVEDDLLLADEESDFSQAPRKRKSNKKTTKKKKKSNNSDNTPKRQKTSSSSSTHSPGKRKQPAPTTTTSSSSSAMEVDSEASGNQALAEFTFDSAKTATASAAHLAKRQKLAASTNLEAKAADRTVAKHKMWSFLDPAKRKDLDGHRPDHPQYDPRTLYIPDSDFRKMSPGEEQYWRIKQKNYDVILFFKMGKFYELFDDDADIGVERLGLQLMNSTRRHAGFPEAAFTKYAEQLVAMGFKVGRVEQTETPQALKESNSTAKKGKKRKVVRRDLVGMLTKGTLVDPNLIDHESATFLLALREDRAARSYGVCFVDTSTGSFHVGQFEDDRQRSILRTLLAQIRPEEIVFPRDNLSAETNRVLRSELRQNHIKNPIKDNEEFWTALRTSQELETYFDASAAAPPSSSSSSSSENDEKTGWPQTLAECKDKALAMSALGGCVWYLRRNLLDTELVSMRKFSVYDPSNPRTSARHMILDGQTLMNLEVLENEQGGTEGTLLRHLDHCISAFGKRLMKQWVSLPLHRTKDINVRLDAVEDIMGNDDLSEAIRKLLTGVPDLERFVSRIHAMSYGRDKNAVMYTNINAKKLQTFLKVLKSFQQCTGAMKRITDSLSSFDLKSDRLRNLLTVGATYPDVSEQLEFFDNAFDKREAVKKGYIIPRPGVNQRYDELSETINDIQKELTRYLRDVKSQIGCQSVKYIHKAKEKYQLEVPLSYKKRMGDEFQLMSQTKKVCRYGTSITRKLVAKLDEAEFERDALLRGVMREIFSQFAEHNASWMKAVNCLAELDCLRSLALVSAFQGDRSVRPEFVDSDAPFLELRTAAHPAIAAAMGPKFIPNDTVLGCEENDTRFILVSGPNMGGKSTLLRQTCLAVIIAQIGCYVPAEKCRLRPVDRIFTRVGANDKIMQGQSTFLVELEETANILRHATDRSLIILDELGRGTSTFDGTAIAYAVTKHLCEKVKCLTLFSTHYHMLMEEFKSHPAISMYHMSCVVNHKEETVTFLYRFAKGICPKSYGMNVAKLAGLPDVVVKRARDMSIQFQERLEAAHQASSPHASVPSSSGAGDLSALVQAVKAAIQSGSAEQIQAMQQKVKIQLGL